MSDDSTAVNDLDEYLDHFQGRVIQDALNEASVVYWTRRADLLEAAMPREGDYTGRATSHSLAARRQRLGAEVLACRRRALMAMPALWLPSEAS